jgi:hypothetical protein
MVIHKFNLSGHAHTANQKLYYASADLYFKSGLDAKIFEIELSKFGIVVQKAYDKGNYIHSINKDQSDLLKNIFDIRNFRYALTSVKILYSCEKDSYIEHIDEIILKFKNKQIKDIIQ